MQLVQNRRVTSAICHNFMISPFNFEITLILHNLNLLFLNFKNFFSLCWWIANSSITNWTPCIKIVGEGAGNLRRKVHTKDLSCHLLKWKQKRPGVFGKSLAKGQIISEGNISVFKFPKKQTKFLKDFCPSKKLYYY